MYIPSRKQGFALLKAEDPYPWELKNIFFQKKQSEALVEEPDWGG